MQQKRTKADLMPYAFPTSQPKHYLSRHALFKLFQQTVYYEDLPSPNRTRTALHASFFHRNSIKNSSVYYEPKDIVL